MTGKATTYPVTDKAWGVPLFVLSLLQLMVVLDGTVVIFALPALQEQLGLSDTGRTWVVTAYALAYGGLLLLGGRLGDAWGRKRVFLLGVTVFTLASLACGLAQNEVMLLAARVAQGLGAAVSSPTAMALLVVTFAPGKVRGQAFSVYAMMTGIGSVAGLVVGGALTERSWRWIFLINVPLGVIIVLLGMVFLQSSAAERFALDIRGAVLATGGCTALVYALTTGGDSGFVQPLVIIFLVLGLTAFVLFLRSQRVAQHPVLPLHLFGDPRRRATFVALALGGAILMTLTVNVALFIQEVVGYTPLRAGLTFIPFAIALGGGSEVAARLCLKVQPRWVAAAGTLLLIFGLFLCLPLDQYARFFPALVIPTLVIGTGLGFILIPLTLSVVAGVRPADVGPLTAISLVAQTLSGPVGLAGAGAAAQALVWGPGGIAKERSKTVFTPETLATLAEGYHLVLTILMVLAALLLVVVVWGIRFTPAEVAEGKLAEQQSQGVLGEVDPVDDELDRADGAQRSTGRVGYGGSGVTGPAGVQDRLGR